MNPPKTRVRKPPASPIGPCVEEIGVPAARVLRRFRLVFNAVRTHFQNAARVFRWGRPDPILFSLSSRPRIESGVAAPGFVIPGLTRDPWIAGQARNDTA